MTGDLMNRTNKLICSVLQGDAGRKEASVEFHPRILVNSDSGIGWRASELDYKSTLLWLTNTSSGGSSITRALTHRNAGDHWHLKQELSCAMTSLGLWTRMPESSQGPDF